MKFLAQRNNVLTVHPFFLIFFQNLNGRVLLIIDTTSQKCLFTVLLIVSGKNDLKCLLAGF